MKIGHRARDLEDPDSGLTIGDLLDFIEHADESMAVYRILNPDWEWSLTNQLIAFLIDFHQMQAWAGHRKGRKPKPIPRPGVTDKETKRYTTSTSSSRADVDAWLAAKMRTS